MAALIQDENRLLISENQFETQLVIIGDQFCHQICLIDCHPERKAWSKLKAMIKEHQFLAKLKHDVEK